MFEQPEEILSHLLVGIAKDLDLPDDVHEGIVDEYTLLGQYLIDQGAAGTSEWTIYPQGSMRLGTVVLPSNGHDEFDIDLVCLIRLLKQSVTQERLKNLVGDQAKAFVRDHMGRQDGPRDVKEGGRCWTLLYPERRFHMDTLPAIPDPDGNGTAILLTDRDLRAWQHSDPIGYEQWFRQQMASQFLHERAILAKTLRQLPEQVPVWRVKTALQQAVQVLKRHRDLYFAQDPEGRPASILITTTTGLGYQGASDVFAAVHHAAGDMISHFENRNGVIWLPNPVNDEENFADRWNKYPEQRQKFIAWIDRLRRDLDAALGEKGLNRVAKSLQFAFGESQVVRAAERLGTTYRELRETGMLTMASSGLLSTSAKTSVADHGFHGETRSPNP